MHTLLGIGSESGYPMTANEIKQTMEDYIMQVCGGNIENKIEYIYDSFFVGIDEARSYIHDGYPVILTMTNYETDNYTSGNGEKRKYHTVVAYGYQEDFARFMVHIGWRPNTLEGTQVIIS